MGERRVRWAATVCGAALGVVLAATPAAAHTGLVADGVRSGLLHPLTGPDHLLAMVAVGVLAVVLDRSLAVPAAFLGAMVAGGALGLAGVPLPGGEVAIAVSVVALGAAIVAGAALHRGAALALVAAAGLVHGHAHGAEAPAAAHPLAYVVAFVAVTAALHAGGWGVGTALRSRPALRAGLGTAFLGAGIGLVAAVA